ncbi:MAG TPA: hypothetical protein DCY88_02490 [Cyanobacteria bacterium UBA11372]|nr:hypothetical protein [Cyanobacteria bacterium UBA11372]
MAEQEKAIAPAMAIALEIICHGYHACFGFPTVNPTYGGGDAIFRNMLLLVPPRCCSTADDTALL